MNILVLSWRDPKHPLSGGAEQVMHEHMKGWIAKGHKVTLLASRFPGSFEEENIDGVWIIRKYFTFGYIGVFQAFWYYLQHRHDFNCVVDQFHGLPFFTPFYVHKPILAVIQEVAQKVWFLNPLPVPLNWIVGLMGFWGEPFLFLPYRWTTFMTGSNSAKNDVSKFGIPKERIAVVPHGLIIKHPPFRLSKEKKITVTFLGVLSKDKGIEDAIRCFALLKKHGEFQFWIIGRVETDSYGKKIKDLVGSLGIKVHFWGFVDQEKKFELLMRSHILVNPSVREGWGLVNTEANAMGTPVVAYNSPGLVDSVKDGFNGIICKNNTAEDLASEIIKLSEDRHVLHVLSRQAILWSKQFSWEKSTKCSLGLIEKLVS